MSSSHVFRCIRAATWIQKDLQKRKDGVIWAVTERPFEWGTG